MKRDLRAIAVVGMVSAVMVVGATVPLGAAPAPSVTITMVCDKGVPPTWDHSLRGIYNFGFQDANGAPVSGLNAQAMECPEAGGRVRQKITTTAPAASAGFSCWNGTINVGSRSGALPLKDDCSDNGGSLHFAQVTVR